MLRITLSANGSLYCCSDGVRGRGAAVKYLSHNASFHSKEKIAPSNRGIKHLVMNQQLQRLSPFENAHARNRTPNDDNLRLFRKLHFGNPFFLCADSKCQCGCGAPLGLYRI